MPIGRHSLGCMTNNIDSLLKETLRRLHVSLLAQHRVDQIAIPIDGPIEVAPVPMDFHGPNTGIHVKIGQRGKEQYMFKGHLHITRDANLFQILSPMAYAFSFSKKVYGIFAVFLAFSHVLSLSIL